MRPLNYKFIRHSYFEKIGGAGRTDRRTDGMQRLMRPIMVAPHNNQDTAKVGLEIIKELCNTHPL